MRAELARALGCRRSRRTAIFSAGSGEFGRTPIVGACRSSACRVTRRRVDPCSTYEPREVLAVKSMILPTVSTAIAAAATTSLALPALRSPGPPDLAQGSPGPLRGLAWTVSHDRVTLSRDAATDESVAGCRVRENHRSRRITA